MHELLSDRTFQITFTAVVVMFPIQASEEGLDVAAVGSEMLRETSAFSDEAQAVLQAHTEAAALFDVAALGDEVPPENRQLFQTQPRTHHDFYAPAADSALAPSVRSAYVDTLAFSVLAFALGVALASDAAWAHAAGQACVGAARGALSLFLGLPGMEVQVPDGVSTLDLRDEQAKWNAYREE